MLKPGYWACGVFLAATVFFNLATEAQPVNLTCKKDQGTSEARVAFDESAQTAGFTISESGDVPVVSATFTETEISWRSYSSDFDLNRTTGTLRKNRWDSNLRTEPELWHCTAAEKKFKSDSSDGIIIALP